MYARSRELALSGRRIAPPQPDAARPGLSPSAFRAGSTSARDISRDDTRSASHIVAAAASPAEKPQYDGSAVPFLSEFARVAALTILPLLLFAIAVVAVLVAQERASVLEALDRRASTAAAELDRMFDRQIALLTTLAGSHALATDNLAAFYEEAQRARELQPDWYTIVVADAATGQQRINLLRLFGDELPISTDLGTHEQVVRTGNPVIVANPHLRGAVSALPVFGIRVPVQREGRVAYVLSAALDPKRLERALARLDLPPGWVGSVIDATGTTIVCARCARERVGQRVASAVMRRIGAGQPGLLATAERGDAESYVAFARAPLSGWFVSVSVAVSEVTSLWRRKLWIVGLGGFISVAAALAAIGWVVQSRRVVQRRLEALVHQRTAALQESEQRCALLANAAREGVAMHDLDRIVEANASFAEMFGYAPDEVRAKPPAAFIASDAREKILAMAVTGHVEHCETIGLHKDGSSFPIAFSATTTEYHGRAMRVWLVRDLTAQKKAEARLRALEVEIRHAARLTDMGQMAAALAHELAQPLTAVANYIGGCRRLLRNDEIDGPTARRLKEVLTRASNQTLRAGEILRRIRDFIAKDGTERRVENAAEVVEEAWTLALTSARHRGVKARLAVETSAHVFVNKVQIQQVMVNLIRNAVEAMETIPRKELEVRVAEAGDAVEMSITDTGVGLSAEIADRLFHPFASTKSRGMGIGLSVCREIVEAHDGRIWAEPNCQGGTTFRFTLPTVDRDAARLC
jgi:two-component system sensor kinase FixL